MYARSNCSVSPATAEIAGSFKGIPVGFMDSWMARVKRGQPMLPASLAKASGELVLQAMQQAELPSKVKRQELALKVSRPAVSRRVSENRPEQAKLGRP